MKRTPAQQKQFEAAEALNREQYGELALPEDQISYESEEAEDTKLNVHSGKLGHNAKNVGGKEQNG